MPVWLIVLLVSVVTYFLSQILILAISRYREFAADRGSALITGAPEHLMSALQKIASDMFRIPERDLRQVETMNAFFIIPTSVKKGAASLFMTHPPLEKRLAALRRSPGRWVARLERAAASDIEATRLAVGLRDVLLGKKKLAAPARERLFALTTAAVTLRHRARTAHGRRGGSRLQAPLRRRIRPGRERPPAVARRGRGRARLEARAARGLVRLHVDHCPGSRSRGPGDDDSRGRLGLEEQGFGGQLLAAVFKFDGGKNPVYWIYGYKRGAFWPFVPMGEEQERDNAEELELKAKLEQSSRSSRTCRRWFGVFDAPL